MNLQKRFIMTNTATVIIPLLFTIAASIVFLYVSSKVYNTEISQESISKLTNIEYEFIRNNSNSIKKNPEFLLSKDFHKRLTSSLSEINADAIVLKNYKIIYSSGSFGQIDIEKCLDTYKNSFLRKTVVLNGKTYLFKIINTTFTDDSRGTVIMLAPIGRDDIASKNFVLFLIITFLTSFFVVNIIFSYYFSKSILRPLSRLKSAANEISCGDLAHEVVEQGDREIRELCRSFELMRLKLKESVYTQSKYDDNRKMLISSISHDLRTPITSIKGYVEGILDGIANNPEKVDKYLRTIYQKAQHVDGMIDDLLLYSKLDLNQIPFNFEQTDIIMFLEDCVSEMEPEMEKTSIKIHFSNLLNCSSFVMIDRDRMRRVVLNILDNSKKYMSNPNGLIELNLRENKSNIIIEIKDNGSGIHKADLPHIFDKFYRADTARSQKSGSGLGLAIARQIVEGHGGRIWGTSKENEGTTILISLNKVMK